MEVDLDLKLRVLNLCQFQWTYHVLGQCRMANPRLGPPALWLGWLVYNLGLGQLSPHIKALFLYIHRWTRPKITNMEGYIIDDIKFVKMTSLL